MPPSPITVILVGLAIVVVGGIWAGFAVFGRGKGGWGTSLGLAGAFATGSAVLHYFAVDTSLALAAGALAAASLVSAVMRTELPTRVVRGLGRPLPQAGLIAMCGLGMIAYGMYRIDADLQHDLDEASKIIDEAAGPPELGPSSAPAARTDLGRAIPLWVPSATTTESLQSFTEEDYLRRMRLNARLIQTGPVDGEYNCHGWVFTGGKFWVRGAWVETILRDNGYRETKSPMIGDLCIFRDVSGEVSHTAIVRGLGAEGLVLLESKWGKLGRYIHNATENHAYSSHTPKYYRTKRGTHLLAGIDNVKPEMFAGAAEE